MIRITGILWLGALLIAAAAGMMHAHKEASAATQAAAEMRQQYGTLSDAELQAVLTATSPMSAARNISPWYSRDTAQMAYLCIAIGVFGALSAFALAWILDGFAAPPKA